MKRKIYLLSLLFCIYAGLSAQTYHVNNNAHSHNDYLQNQPFHDAYSNRFASIEIDIFLVNETLYIAHDRRDITETRTIESLYIDPVMKQIKLNGGKVYPDGGNLQFLIDLKTEGEATLRALEKVFQPIRKYFDTEQNPDAIRLVVSGNIPAPERFAEFDRIFWFDGRPNIRYTSEQQKRVAFYSVSFALFSRWNGLGRLPENEYRQISFFVDSIHSLGKKLRFWGNPDTKTCWQAFIKLGIDYINTDNPSGLALFLNEYPNNNHVPETAYRPYQPSYRTDGVLKNPKNIILMISDGAGLSQIWAAATANKGALNVINCRSTGYLRTDPADDYNTDSAAAGSAIATGQKTRNRYIGVDTAGNILPNIVEYLSTKGVKCGIVSNDNIAGATPSTFYAHCSERSLTDSILSYLLHTPAAFVAGGGNLRNEKMQQLVRRLEKAGYVVCEGISNLNKQSANKQVICFDTDRYDAGYRLIETAFDESVHRLANPKGFFLMIEGAKIDGGGHARNINQCVDEYLSFDRVVGKALEFADNDGETLVIITSDHETGGLVLLDGNYGTGNILGYFATTDHTGTPVPVFSYGPRSDRFTGFIDNTEIFEKVVSFFE